MKSNKVSVFFRSVFFFCFISLFCFSCSDKPTGPGTVPVVNAGNDTTVYILDTLMLTGTINESAIEIDTCRWDIYGDGKWDTTCALCSVSCILPFFIPESAVGTVTAVFEAENAKGERGRDSIIITVLTDTVLIAEKAYYTADSAKGGFARYIYDSASHAVKETNYGADSTVTGWLVVSYQNGNKLSQTHYKADGSITAVDSFVYDTNGHSIAVIMRDKNGNITGYDSLFYGGDALADTIRHYGADGSLWYYYLHTYNTSGQLTEKKYYSKTGVAGGYSAYEYNSKGRLALKKTYNAGGLFTGWYDCSYLPLHFIRE